MGPFLAIIFFGIFQYFLGHLSDFLGIFGQFWPFLAVFWAIFGSFFDPRKSIFGHFWPKKAQK